MTAPGTVVISIDAELGWGFHHHDPLPAGRVRAARAGWRWLLDRFDEYGIPATWAVVGHLLLDRCDRRHRGHPAGERCCARGAGGLGPSDLWFAPDLVDAVVDATVDHELACHGFTHLHFQHDRMTPELADRELAACRDAAAGRGLEPTTFVYPVNRPGYRSRLAAHGFDCYRGPDPDAGTSRRRLGKLELAVGRGAPPIVHPAVDPDGLVDVPGSVYLFGFEGPARRVLEPTVGDPMVGYVRRGLDRLVDRGGTLHGWFHPHNLRTDRDEARLRAIFDAIERRRETGAIEVETMGAVADAVRERAPEPHLRPARVMDATSGGERR